MKTPSRPKEFWALHVMGSFAEVGARNGDMYDVTFLKNEEK